MGAFAINGLKSNPKSTLNSEVKFTFKSNFSQFLNCSIFLNLLTNTDKKFPMLLSGTLMTLSWFLLTLFKCQNGI